MSRKYKVRRKLEMWQIHENPTNQIVFQSSSKQTVMDLKLKLENGSGFNGRTPSFFTQRYPSFCGSE